MSAIGIAVQRVEMVPVVCDVDAHLLARRYGVADGLVLSMLLAELNGDAYFAHWGTSRILDGTADTTRAVGSGDAAACRSAV